MEKILDYFSEATHIGCTATPIETKQASSQTYFGEHIYEYSLKQGINDGFLAPYKVIRVGLDKDLVGYRPEAGKRDDKGYEIIDREYNIKDFDRTLVLDQRTKVVAAKVTEYLKKTGRMSKTIVFCINVEHAERMRQALINENKDLYKKDNRYIMRITGDNKEGKKQLENFIDEESDYPVIAVTSKLMTTGVDAKMCKLIVLDNNFSNEHGMTEFKQIIGRGTRLLEEKGKTYFTIMDFRNASRLFADKDFDGIPDAVMDIPDGSEIIDLLAETDDDKPSLDTANVTATSMADPPLDGDDGDIPKKYYISVLLDAVREETGKVDIDDFDLICHLAYDKAPLTRIERANNVRKRGYLYKYAELAQKVLGALLDKYADEGIRDIEDTPMWMVCMCFRIWTVIWQGSFGLRRR